MRVYSRNSVFKLIHNALMLFMGGRMFRDNRYLAQRLGIGIGATAIVLVLLSLVVTSPIVPALVAGLAGGALQPFLFEDVRYQ
jgi:uncharacterized membrane protein YdjX (TVP38/TMEM64 family)